MARFRQEWPRIQDRLIVEVDRDYGIYEGRTFKADRFARWLTEHRIPWPLLDSGALDLSDDVFRQMARPYACVAPIRELRHTLSQLRLNDLAVGADGHNRCLLSAFRARTGRNQPSNSRFIFGPSCWLRGLIRPELGRAVAYIDWEQQEFGIAAALSGDAAMKAAYSSDDPYLTFAKQAGAVPADVVREKTTACRASFSARQAQEYERSYRLAGVRLHIVLRRSPTTVQSNTPRPICRFQPYTPTVCETGVRRRTFCTGRHVVQPLARLDSAGQITDYSLHTIQQRENGEIKAEQGSGGRIRRQVRPVYTLPRTVRLVAAPCIRLFRQSGQLFAQYSPMVSTFDGSTAGLHDCWCRENVGAR